MANCALLLNDGPSYLKLNSTGLLLLNDNSCEFEPGVSGPAGAGGAIAWKKQYEEEQRRQKKRDFALERLREQEFYKRLKRKLAMYQAMLEDVSGRGLVRLEAKITSIENEIKRLEWDYLQ
jgi:hypothetical protein